MEKASPTSLLSKERSRTAQVSRSSSSSCLPNLESKELMLSLIGLARINYLAYLQVAHFLKYRPSRHTRLIAKVCERIERGELKRVMFFLPPRHSKSMTVTESFPSWFIGKNPNRRVIEVSYGESLAQRFGRANRRKIENFGNLLFDIEMARDNSSVTNWSIEGHDGGMISAGVGGPLSGQGSDCLIIDDPCKNRQEANSPTYRNMLWDEYRNTLLTRLQPNASIILIQTRWHEDDLAGRILAQEPEKWTVVKLPAEAEEEDPLGRVPGEPLWPEFGFDQAWMENTKKTVGSQVWNALYQQRPSPQEGALIKRSWWKYYIVAPSHFDDIVLSWDMTFKDEAAAASGNPDYVVGQVWGRVEADKYLLDQVRGKMDFPDTLKAVRALKAKWKESTAILIEDSANGPAIIASLKHEISGIIPWPAQGSKTERLSAVAPQIEAGNVFVPDPIIAEWICDYVEEFSVFPNGNNDDQVDSTTQALRYWMRPDKAPASISTYRERTNP